MPTLGDFFSSAPFARPVNPRPISYTAIARGRILPGGAPNPSGIPIRSTITSAFVFIGGDGAEGARLEANRSLLALCKGTEKQTAILPQDTDYDFQLMYEILFRAVHEWDAKTRKLGDRQFPTVEVLKELIEPREANRMLKLYNEYVSDEHPESITEDQFQGTTERVPRVV